MGCTSSSNVKNKYNFLVGRRKVKNEDLGNLDAETDPRDKKCLNINWIKVAYNTVGRRAFMNIRVA